MSWIPSLLLLVALQTLHGTAGDTMTAAAAEAQWNAILEINTITQNECDPNCTDNTDKKVVDPLDCHKFYFCTDDEALGPLDCPDGEYFDDTEEDPDCVPIEGDDCKPICRPETGGDCTFECEGDSGYLADRFDCSTYYDCKEKDKILTCEDDKPFFNGKECQTDESQCCHCKPYCYKGDTGKKVMDPLNCTNYYVCMEDSKVPEYSINCPNGNFDILSYTCSTTAPCITLCTNVVNPKGCIDVFTCKEEGYFATCPNHCDSRYYHCTSGDIGSTVTPTKCAGDDVFIADTNQCVDSAECPYDLPAF